ncbi:MAG: NAD(+)/NADH kinase [Clostridia bacterium]|nr:NAD(+)/NADH kinase [Clostridia bacterium]
MKHYFLMTNRSKDPDLKITNQICDYLISKGCSCTIHNNHKPSEHDGIIHIDDYELPSDTECVITLGGDGTLIQVAHDVAKRECAVIGVNLGKLGYLAEIEKDAIIPTLDRLMKDDFKIEERMMLYGIPYVDKMPVKKQFALNDVVITRSGPLRLMTLHIFVNDRLLKTYGADGIIVSTPTGSTGYNLSAGGPIVEPGSSVVVLTPVNAHTLNARSIILSPEDDIKVVIGEGRRESKETAEVYFDGASVTKLQTGDYVQITKAKEHTRIIKMSKENFLDVLRRKLTDME